MSTGSGPPRFDWWHLLATAVVTIFATFTITVAVVKDEDHPGKIKPKVTVSLGGPGEKKITLDRPAQRILQEQKAEDAAGNDEQSESDLHENKLPPVSVQAEALGLKPPGQPLIPAQVPFASATQPGCTTVLVKNYSSRRGAPVLQGWIHWTGSTPTKGPGGGLANVRWFDTAASQASSHYITDQSGRCWLTVPESQKAWTEANANSWGVSVEITNAGVQPLFQTTAARNIVIKLMRGWHTRWKIPYTHGAVKQGPNNSCIPTKPGFLAHKDGGRCAGGHPDVGTFNMDQLIRDAARGHTVAPLSTAEQHACDVLNFHRSKAHRIGFWSKKNAADASRWKKQIPVGRCLSKYRKR